MKKIVTVTLAVLLASISGWAAADPVKSMRRIDITAEDKAPDVLNYQGKKPGLQQKIARTFDGQPPVIPHAVENFDDINLEENQCLTCHGPAKFQEKKAPKLGDSHFLDRDGKKLADVSMSRHNCTQCHVPQVDAPPLVGTDFVGLKAAAAGKGKKK